MQPSNSIKRKILEKTIGSMRIWRRVREFLIAYTMITIKAMKACINNSRVRGIKVSTPKKKQKIIYLRNSRKIKSIK
jgi:hypothetical protein